MRKTLFAALALLLIGCATLTPAKNFQQIDTSVAALKADLATALRALGGVRPHADAVGRELLDQAIGAINSADKHASAVTPANDKWRTDFEREQGKYNALYNSAWCRLGRFLFGSFLAMAIAAAIGVVLLVIFPAATPWLISLGGKIETAVVQLHAALPLQNLGTKPLQKFFGWIGGLLRIAPVAPAAAAVTINRI
jgi:hypothetical protein